MVDHHVVFGALVGAIAWNIDHLVVRHPVELVARADRRHRRCGDRQVGGAADGRAAFKTVAFIFVSPLLGFVLGSLR